MKAIQPAQLQSLHLDSTVSEKNITYPTEAKLCYKSLQRLVREAQKDGVELRQSYKRVSKQALRKSQGYAQGRQMNRARKEVKKLKNYLGRTIRDIKRKARGQMSTYLKQELELAERLLKQKRTDKNKIYSLHEPEVHCIAKGKSHKKYEFGHKVSITVTTKGNWVTGSYGLEGNPYDVHTVTYSLDKIEKQTGIKLKEIFTDRGYRGHDYEGEAEVHIDKTHRGRTPQTIWKKLKQRARIELVIGHLKRENRMGINRLGGLLGNKVNSLLSGAGFNFRKLLRVLLSFFQFLIYGQIGRNHFSNPCYHF